jgi:hypothetical protein
MVVADQSEVRDAVLLEMRPWLEPGEHPLPHPGLGHRLVVPLCPAGLVATVFGDRGPLVTIGVAATLADADAIWPGLEQLYRSITDRSPLALADFRETRCPDRLPWCGVVLLPPLLLPPHPPALKWLGDFERCLAWAWLDRLRGCRARGEGNEEG